MFFYRPKRAPITDKYRIRCKDWQNDGEAIRYMFGYYIRKPDMIGIPPITDIKFRPETDQKELLDEYFPAGEIQIYIRIKNPYGQYVELANQDLVIIVSKDTTYFTKKNKNNRLFWRRIEAFPAN